jgi:hypothetical protein
MRRVDDVAKHSFGRFEMCQRRITVELTKFGNSECDISARMVKLQELVESRLV